MGHVISAAGVLPNKKKVEAVLAAPTPKDVSQVRSFLGLLNYYGNFLPNLSSVLASLYRLLDMAVKWRWHKEEEDSFREAKELLISTKLLVHFDPDKELILTCDASPYGVGAVLAHKEKDGTERPISYGFRSLMMAETKSSQLDKEGLAIIFAVKRYRRKIIIHSDHKPLQHILGNNRPVPAMASARIQRCALTLAAYSYTILYKPGKEISGLSRLPLPESPSEVPVPGETVLLLQMSPVMQAKLNNIDR